MGRVADSTTAAMWRKRLARQGWSRLSIAEFCRREEVSPASFYAWRKRLAGSGQANCRQPLFVPVKMAAVERPTGVQIELPGGAVVTLPVESSAELVTTAIRAAIEAGSIEEVS
jgi:hypothetical protein